MDLKNWKDWKTTLFGLLWVGLAVWYLVCSEDQSVVIFFGMVLFGAVFIFLPNDIKPILRSIARGVSRGIGNGMDDGIDIDISTSNKEKPDREIPNEK